MKPLILLATLLFCVEAWAEQNFEPKAGDLVFRFEKDTYYRVKITKEATLNDIKWLFNSVLWLSVDEKNKKLFEGKERAFTFEEMK